MTTDLTKLKDSFNRIKHREPLWKGPQVDGISQSLINEFLSCRERFRIKVIEGLAAQPEFSAPLTYGNMWHLCEELHGAGENWKAGLKEYADKLAKEFHSSQVMIYKWQRICAMMFPIYLQHWYNDNEKMISAGQERVFLTRYDLPSGRYVMLRGKLDEEILCPLENKMYLKENKTPGKIDPEKIGTRLTFDLQTMLYFIVFKKVHAESELGAYPVEGLFYNIARRPLSPGVKHCIKPKAKTKKNPAETPTEFINRLEGLVKEDTSEYFQRWKVSISDDGCKRFERTFLIPVLEQLCDWWEHIEQHPFDPWTEGQRVHYRTPFGLYSLPHEGRTHPFDQYLDHQTEFGLSTIDTLFPELA